MGAKRPYSLFIMKYTRRARRVKRPRRSKRRATTGRKRKAPRKWNKRKSYKKARKTVAKNVTEGVSWTNSYIKTGRKKRGYSMVKSLAWTGCDSITLRKRGVKNFTDSGYVPMYKGKLTVGGEYYYPLYAICLNDQSFGFPSSYPVRTLGQHAAGGSFFWMGKNTMANDGSNITYSDLEKGKLSPATRLIWRNTQIKMNLWGSKNRPVRFTVQICSMKDPRHCPFNRQYLASGKTTLSEESQQVWEETLKQYTFNPISKIDWHNGSDLKVHKSFDITIQPTETIDNDTSPKVHSLTWNTTWDKTLKFQRLMTTSTDEEGNMPAAFNEVGEKNENLDTMCPFPDEKTVVFLLVRCSDFGDVVELNGFDNAIHGSFDYDIRTTHLIPGII